MKLLQAIINGSNKHCKKELGANIDFKRGSMLKDGFRVQGSGFWVQRSGVLGSRFKVKEILRITAKPKVFMA